MRATTSWWAIAAGLAVLACGPSGSGKEGQAGGAKRAPASASGQVDEVDDVAAEGGGDFPSAAERTRAMEERAAALEQEFRAAMAAATSEEERVRAYQEFERGREELNEMGGEGDGGDDAYGPPPEP